MPEKTSGPWSTFILVAEGSAVLENGTAIEAGDAIFAGRSTDPERLYRQYRAYSRRQEQRDNMAVLSVIHELEKQGVDVGLSLVATDLPLQDARIAKAALIAELTKVAAPLVNTLRLDGGRGGVVNHETPGTAAHALVVTVKSREFHRALAQTPEGRKRSSVKSALHLLKSGGALTATRRGHIESAGPGSVAKAKAILAEQGREGDWPD